VILGHNLGFVSLSSSIGSAVMLLHYLGEFLRSGLLAAAAGRLFNQARRSGLLESLLGCPLSAAEVVRGYWSVLWRHLRWPLGLVVVVNGLPVIHQLLNAVSGTAGPGLGVVLWYRLPGLARGLLLPITASWVALWFGLIFPNMGHVIGRTFALITVVPWLVSLLVPLLIRSSPAQAWLPWWGLIQLVVLTWLAGLAWWARRRLVQHLCHAAAAPEDFRGRRFWRGPAPTPTLARAAQLFLK